MKKLFVRALAGLLTAGVLICPAFAASGFPDVDENAEYAEIIEYISQMGYMVGDANGNFNPDNTVTRAEMAVILCNMLGESENLSIDGSVFTDVPAEHWANRYVVKAAELGLVTGYGDGRFGPADGVTYEQTLTMVLGIVNQKEYAEQLGGYPDGFIQAATDLGYTSGVTAKQGDLLHRWEIATIVFNVLLY